MTRDVVGQAKCRLVVTHEHAAWSTCGLERACGCARVCARMCACAHVCVIIVSELSIIFGT